jgi:hypothetical protein
MDPHDAHLSTAVRATSARFSSGCRSVYDRSASKVMVQTSHAAGLGVNAFRLVNSTHVITLVVLCEPGVNPVGTVCAHLGTCSMSPRIKSKIFFGLNGSTLSMTLKMAAAGILEDKPMVICVIGCNLAGCCSADTVAILAGQLMDLTVRSGRGRIRGLRAGFQMVNNVMILYASKYVTDIERLIELSPDAFVKYEPGNFPGAFFSATASLGDCKYMIAYTTSLFSFLGCRHPAMLATTLSTRVEIIRRCQLPVEISDNSKMRQQDRIRSLKGNEGVREITNRTGSVPPGHDRHESPMPPPPKRARLTVDHRKDK